MSQNELEQSAFFGELPGGEREVFLEEMENEFADQDRITRSHVRNVRWILGTCGIAAAGCLFAHPPILVVLLILVPLVASLGCWAFLFLTITELGICIHNFCTALRWDIAASSSTNDLKAARVRRVAQPIETAETSKSQVQ
jgi:hypothetical protein